MNIYARLRGKRGALNDEHDFTFIELMTVDPGYTDYSIVAGRAYSDGGHQD